MARKKNGTFVGVGISDVDADAPSFGRVVENAVGDTALIFDKITGSHAEAVTVHSGGPLGALLGMPLINHHVDRSLNLSGILGAKGASGGIGDTWIYACPILVPAGETSVLVEAVFAFLPGAEDIVKPYARVCTTANVEVDRQVLTHAISGGENGQFRWTRLTGLSSGWNLFFIGMDTEHNADLGASGAIGRLLDVRVRPRNVVRGLTIGDGVELLQYLAPGPPHTSGGNTIAGVTTPAAADGVNQHSFDTTMFGNLQPIDGRTLAGVNRDLNGLLEYITGWPAGGNSSYVHQDQDGGGAADPSDPARSRFDAHTQSLYGTEGELDFPVWCEGFGSFLAVGGKFIVALAEPPTVGMLDWYAPWPRTIAEQTIRQTLIPLADFPTGPAHLKCAVLLGSEHQGLADASQWTIKCQTSTGNNTAVPVDTDGTKTLWLATITGVPFTGDANELVQIKMSRGSAKPAGTNGIGEVCVLGVALAFDP